MLDFTQIQKQLVAFGRHRVREEDILRTKVQHAVQTFRALDTQWEALRERVEKVQHKHFLAGLLENPVPTYTAPPRPTPITVVATDGSQIYPDRHTEPACYLLNIGQVAFQYGTLEPPHLAAWADLRYREKDMAEIFSDLLAGVNPEVVSAIRDELELELLLETARTHRVENRPLIAMADGTLIRWMLRGLQNRAFEQTMIARYTHWLDHFRAEALPLCAYISNPGNSEVINLLEYQMDGAPDGHPLSGLRDAQLFREILHPGERSALFESGARIQKEYGSAHPICYFYVHVGTEIGRVELPRWVADTPPWLDWIHAVILDETQKGAGYPMILTEAHEQAVIRGPERAVFYDLLDQAMRAQGLHRYTGSNKQASKRAPRI